MSVTYRVYEYDESMDDRVLKSIGVIGNVFSQLNSVEYEQERELMENADSQVIGRNDIAFAMDVTEQIKTTEGIKTVTEEFLDTLESIAENSDHRYSDDVLEWFSDREGEEVFVVAH